METTTVVFRVGGLGKHLQMTVSDDPCDTSHEITCG